MSGIPGVVHERAGAREIHVPVAVSEVNVSEERMSRLSTLIPLLLLSVVASVSCAAAEMSGKPRSDWDRLIAQSA